ncbi:transglutaminase-like domain-containing protein [Flaviaesturariibacter aridisoli]|nr:transglutaminase-like domain-containing protein [Flaviaesturariibacter aridisoli]
MRNGLLLLPVLLLAASACQASEKSDSNIVIQSAREVYEFVYNKKAGRVEIRQDLQTTYRCNSFRTTVPVMELYDNETSIDNVEAWVDGKAQKNLSPAYGYYSVDDIFYSDARTCYFELPLQKQGALAEVRVQKTITDPRYFTSIYLTDRYTVGTKQVFVKVPRWMKVELKPLNFAGFSVTTRTEYDSKSDADIYLYTLSNAPAQEHESNSPGPSYLYPHLLVLAKSAAPAETPITYFSTVKDQYGWYRSLVQSVQNDTAVVGAKAREIIAGKTSDADKIRAVYYWVQNNIRYIAFEDGIAGFRPEKAHEVLRRKYGDCKGMAHLTKELLRSLGYDARLCWIGTNHIAYDYSTPSMSVDNHMICALNWNGKMVFLDATETYSAFDEYAERIQGRQVLVEAGDDYLLTRIPATSWQQNIDASKSELTLSGTDLSGKVSQSWSGEEREGILSQLHNIKKDQSKEAFMRFLSDNNKEYSIQNLNSSGLEQFDGKLSVSYDLSFRNAVSNFGKEYYVALDFRKEYGAFTFTPERVYDYWFDFKGQTLREVTLNVPAGYTVTSVPANLSVKNADYDFEISYQQQPGKVLYRKNIIIKNPRLARVRFSQWNADIEQLAKAYNEQIVLTAK